MPVKKVLKANVRDPQEPNYSGFVVIGAGLSRTGTVSLRIALRQLLDGACYHMIDPDTGNKYDVDFWTRALDGRTRKEDWIAFFEGRGYRAALDCPTNLFYEELMEAFPNAKVILTTRDPVSWFRSASNVVVYGIDVTREFSVRAILKLSGETSYLDVIQRAMELILPGFDSGLLPALRKGQDSGIAYFERWNEGVRRSVPGDRLLEFQVEDGWKPLCEFLDLPVPDIPYPRVNDAVQVRKVFRRAQVLSYLVVYVLPVAVFLMLMGLWL